MSIILVGDIMSFSNRKAEIKNINSQIKRIKYGSVNYEIKKEADYEEFKTERFK